MLRCSRILLLFCKAFTRFDFNGDCQQTRIEMCLYNRVPTHSFTDKKIPDLRLRSHRHECEYESRFPFTTHTSITRTSAVFTITCTRVPTPPGKSWIFFLKNSRTWKVPENHFGPGKMESPGKISLKVVHFFSGSH